MIIDEKQQAHKTDAAEQTIDEAAQEPKPAITYVLLVRHGENEWVSSGKLAGRTPGVHLNDKGKAQAAQLAEFLSKQPIDAIYSSPLVRCIETATPVAAALKMSVREEPGVLEVDYGAWHGIELKEATRKPEWQMVQHYPSAFRFPDGETLREVQYRAVATIEEIVARHPNQVVAIFSHGDVIRTTMAHYAGIPLDLFQRIQIQTASISTLAFFGGRPVIVNLNTFAEPAIINMEKEVAQPVKDAADPDSLEQELADQPPVQEQAAARTDSNSDSTSE